MSRKAQKIDLMLDRAARLRDMADLARNPKIAGEIHDRAEHVEDMAAVAVELATPPTGNAFHNRATFLETRTLPALEAMAETPSRRRLIDRFKSVAADLRTAAARRDAQAREARS